MGGGLIGKDHEEKLWGEEIVLYLDLGYFNPNIYIYQNVFNEHLRYVHVM